MGRRSGASGVNRGPKAVTALNRWTAVHAAAGAALGWLGVDWQYAVAAALGSVALEVAARERLDLGAEEGDEAIRAVSDVAVFLGGYALGHGSSKRSPP